jgi:hypothetical protein
MPDNPENVIVRHNHKASGRSHTIETMFDRQVIPDKDEHGILPKIITDMQLCY